MFDLEFLLGEDEEKNSHHTYHDVKEARVRFKDKDGEEYELVLSYKKSDHVADMTNLEMDLTYPSGTTIGLESIWVLDTNVLDTNEKVPANRTN